MYDLKNIVNKFALRFTEANHSHVNHGPFYVGTGTYTTCFWDFLVRPLTNGQTGYVISSGYGPEHNMLIGFNTSGNKAGVTGNMLVDGVQKDFSTPLAITLGDWVHIAVAFTQSAIGVYVNGICENVVSAVGTNRTANNSVDDYVLFIGGSDHSNIDIDLAWVRGFEGIIPLDVSFWSYFRTMKFPRSTYYGSGAIQQASFFCDYTQPGNIMPDLSDGLDGARHPGAFGTLGDVGSFWDVGGQTANIYDDQPIPVWVPANIVKPAHVITPTVPGTAIIYDSFSNRESAPFWYANSAFGLGSTEGGTAGVKTWAGGSGYMVSYGRAFQSQVSGSIANVDAGTANQDVRVTRNKVTTLYARYTDANNYYFCEFGNTDTVTLSKRVAGVDTMLVTQTGLTYNPDIKLKVNGTSLKAYQGGAEVISTTDSSLATGNKAGFKVDGSQVAYVDTFEVYAP